MSDRFINHVDGWVKAMRRNEAPVTNYFQRMSAWFPVAPIIGHTPEKKVRRFVWSRLSRIGHALEERFARFEHHESDEYYGPAEYWLKKEWRWVDRVGEKSKAAMSQPIRDPNWVRPPVPPMVWGFGDAERLAKLDLEAQLLGKHADD